jgi:hypothetical protein
MEFLAYCPECKKRVQAAVPMTKTRRLLQKALETRSEVRLIHRSDTGDHVWKLPIKDYDKVLNLLQDGIL